MIQVKSHGGTAAMRSNRLLIWLYLIFLVTIVAQSAWWFIYISRETDHHAAYRLQRLRTEELQAAYLLRSSPELMHQVEGFRANFPGLVFHPTENSLELHIDPAALREIESDSRRRRRMFFWEGAFFLAVLLAGASMVFVAYRREQAYRRSRELFAAGVSHEFKTPLASLSLYADTIARPELKEPERDRILGHMVEDLQRLRVMVEQVLAVSRAGVTGALNLVLLDPGDLTRQVLRDLSAVALRSGATLESDLPEGLRVRADEQALLSALRNVVGNAIHYSPAPAVVMVRLSSVNGWIRLAVSDEGPGIPRSEHKRIFQSFYRVGEAGTRPAGIHGTGLGLYLVRRNLEAMGGRVELESVPGEGSTFTLILPAHAGGRGE